jgi:hypothetical protein
MSDTNNPIQLFSELLTSPLGDLITSVGQGVGEAQAALDQGALQQTLDIYDISKDSERTEEEMNLLNLIREMGYQPTFYAIPETEVEAQISLSMDLKSEQPATTQTSGYSVSKYKINAAPLNAGNMNRYGLQANAMAKLKFKIVPVPPPQGSADLRLVPDFYGKSWNQTTKEMIENLGFLFELRDDANDAVITEDDALDYPISTQSPASGTISKVGNLLVLHISTTFS